MASQTEDLLHKAADRWAARSAGKALNERFGEIAEAPEMAAGSPAGVYEGSIGGMAIIARAGSRRWRLR